MQTAVDAILYQRDRTRGGDREAVLRVLRDWDATGLVIEDLVEEVEYLSRWDVGEVLKEVGHLVEYRDGYRLAGAGGGAPRGVQGRASSGAHWRPRGADPTGLGLKIT